QPVVIAHDRILPYEHRKVTVNEETARSVPRGNNHGPPAGSCGMSTVLPASGTAFGDKVRARLDQEEVVWLTTVGRDGTPQPNPVWSLLEPGGDSVLTYNRATAARIAHVRERPGVSLNFNNRDHSGDVVVIAGTGEVVDDAPPSDAHPAYQAKYREAIGRI